MMKMMTNKAIAPMVTPTAIPVVLEGLGPGSSESVREEAQDARIVSDVSMASQWIVSGIAETLVEFEGIPSVLERRKREIERTTDAADDAWFSVKDDALFQRDVEW